jgi:predicted DNA-binding transcriptional regulator YafY
MARGDQLSRQWKIIQALTAARQGKSAAELASELECHSRTVYRDLEALQMAGFPLYTDKANGKTLWSILDSGRQQMPIPPQPHRADGPLLQPQYAQSSGGHRLSRLPEFALRQGQSHPARRV